MSFVTRCGITVCATLISLTLAGCNTISGIGQDVSAGGKALTKSADKTQQDLDHSQSSS